MENLTNKYQQKLDETNQVYKSFKNSYESKTIDPDWGVVIDKPFFDKMSLGYLVEIQIYTQIIKDLETLNQ